jgi:hypothetical protein
MLAAETIEKERVEEEKERNAREKMKPNRHHEEPKRNRKYLNTHTNNIENSR